MSGNQIGDNHDNVTEKSDYGIVMVVDKSRMRTLTLPHDKFPISKSLMRPDAYLLWDWYSYFILVSAFSI